MFDVLVAGRYKVGHPIGQGAFGQIYNGTDQQTNEPVAVKFELLPGVAPNQITQLSMEARFYGILKGAMGFPQIKHFGTQGVVKTLVLDLLGPSIGRLFDFKKRAFPLKTVLMLADEMINRVQFLHSKGIVHRDLKPDNFVIGRDPRDSVIYLIDFGLADKFRGFYNKAHVQYEENCEFVGSPVFASLNFLRGCRYSRRDDIESLAYIFIYLAKGSLPWDVHSATNDALKAEVLRLKATVTPADLCRGLPLEFARFLEAARNLAFDEAPNYSQYKQMFRDLFTARGFLYDCNYAWSGSELPKARGPITAQIISERLLVKHSVSNPNFRGMRLRDKAKMRRMETVGARLAFE